MLGILLQYNTRFLLQRLSFYEGSYTPYYSSGRVCRLHDIYCSSNSMIGEVSSILFYESLRVLCIDLESMGGRRPEREWRRLQLRPAAVYIGYIQLIRRVRYGRAVS